MEKIIIKTTYTFDRYSKKVLLNKDSKKRKALDKYFRSKKINLEFIDSIDNNNYIEVMYSSLNEKDKKYLETNYLKGTHKKVAFIRSDKMFFGLVDQYIPAVI